MTLNQLRKLEANWDGNGALAPTAKAIEAVEQITIPFSDGCIQLGWATGKQDGLEVVVTPDGTFRLAP